MRLSSTFSIYGREERSVEEEGGGGRGGVVVVRALFPPCCVPRRARDALIARRWSRAREINGVRFRRAASRTDASLTTAASARTGWAASSEKSDRTTPALAVGSLSRSPPAHSRSPRSHFALRSVPFSRPHVRLRESSRAAWVGRRARGALSLARLGSVRHQSPALGLARLLALTTRPRTTRRATPAARGFVRARTQSPCLSGSHTLVNVGPRKSWSAAACGAARWWWRLRRLWVRNARLPPPLPFLVAYVVSSLSLSLSPALCPAPSLAPLSHSHSRLLRASSSLGGGGAGDDRA